MKIVLLYWSLTTVSLQVFKKRDQAKKLYEQALAVEPNNPTILSNYANLLKKECYAGSRAKGKCTISSTWSKSSNDSLKSGPCSAKEEQEMIIAKMRHAKGLYLKALRSDPNHFMAKRNYAIFLRDFPEMRTKQTHKQPVVTKANIPPTATATSTNMPQEEQMRDGKVMIATGRLTLEKNKNKTKLNPKMKEYTDDSKHVSDCDNKVSRPSSPLAPSPRNPKHAFKLEALIE